jgi:hypothetical protein
MSSFVTPACRLVLEMPRTELNRRVSMQRQAEESQNRNGKHPVEWRETRADSAGSHFLSA